MAVDVAVRHIVRRRAAAIAVVALAVGGLCGGSLSALAGARRSASAIDRLVDRYAPEDVFVGTTDGSPFDATAVSRLPQVLASEYRAYEAMVVEAADGHPRLELAGKINPYLDVPFSGKAGALGARRIIRGHDLDPTKPLDAVIDEELATRFGVEPGDELVMGAYAPSQEESVFGDETGGAATPAPEGPELRLHVTGIARMPVDIHPTDLDEPTTSFGGTMELYLSPALQRTMGDQILGFGAPAAGAPLAVRLRHGLADLDAYRAAVAALPGGKAITVDVSDSDALDSARVARRAVNVETASLLGLAALLGISALVVAALALGRLARSTTDDLPVLRAVGMRPRDLLLVASAPAGAALLGGVVVALAVAMATSPLTPLGLGGRAEIAPGFHLDPLVLGLGVLVLVIAGAAVAALAGRASVRAVVRPDQGAHPGRGSFADGLAALGAPLAPTLGARFATARSARASRAPVRSAVAVGVIALVALVSIATYTHTLQRVHDSPALQGAGWDLAIGNMNLSDYQPEDIARLSAHPDIAGVAAVAAPQGRASIDGEDVSLAGLDPVSGDTGPELVSGRLATRTGEVVLGHRTATRLGADLGDQVTIGIQGNRQRATVVGTALLSPSISPTMQIGDGALVTIAQMRALAPDVPTDFLLADVRDGRPVAAVADSLRADWGRNVAPPIQSGDVANLTRVESVPKALALALAGVAILLFAVTLVLAARQQARDIGILRTLGADRRHLRRALWWQAAWLYLVVLAIGLPLGVIGGRVMWRQVATGIGALVDPSMPAGSITSVAVGSILVTAALAGLMARVSLRHPTHAVLRTE